MGTNITGIGNANAIGFKSRVTGGAYFPPELKDALVGVWSAYGKSNDSTDRNIIKNKIKDKGGDFELLNFAYDGNSGYGKYESSFLDWYLSDSVSEGTKTKYKVSVKKCEFMYIGTCRILYLYNSSAVLGTIKISGISNTDISLSLESRNTEKAFSKDGIYTVDEEVDSIMLYSAYTSEVDVDITIELIPKYQGALVTDGVDDLIVSQKPVQEMLGGSNEITVISMIHQIGGNKVYTHGYTNYIRHSGGYIRNKVSGTDGNGFNKTGIYGYTATKLNTSSMNLGNIVNNILGDKEDYSFERSSTYILDDAKYSVSNFINANGRPSNEGSELAWYWTFIANRVLTEDEINLVIEKYNLDRPGEIVKPQVYYNVKKQKITNDNHAAFNDKLIDYSGNGYDAKLYNFAWKGGSGVAAKKWETVKDYSIIPDEGIQELTIYNEFSWKIKSNTKDRYWTVQTYNSTDASYLITIITDKDIVWRNALTYTDAEGIRKTVRKETNVTANVPTQVPIYGFQDYIVPDDYTLINSVAYATRKDISEFTITVIPSYKDALIFDGVDDYGKVTGLPVLKDYTIAVYRKWLQNYQNSGSLISKSNISGSGSFLMEQKNYSNVSATYSYGARTENLENPNLDKDIYTYQSKYVYNGVPITPGTGVDGTDMWLATIRDRDERFSSFALKTLMLFPYSLSEFLLERQIEKIKSGTLYPGKVEFRPVIPEDENITRIDYFVVDSGVWKVIKPGDYVDVGARIVLNVYTKLPYKIAGVSSTAFTGMTVGPSTALNVWDVKGYIKDKTPQKIKLTLAVNEDIVQWNPTISANIPDSYDAVTEWFINGWETKVDVGDWIKKSDRIFFKLKLKDPLHEIGKVIFGGSECQATKVSNWSESNNLWEIATYSSVGDLSQVFNVQVDEYIKYEDIVQPYPILLGLRDENGNEVSWGGKLRVGSIATFTKDLKDSYLLEGMYNVKSIWLNNENVILVVAGRELGIEKKMEFKSIKEYLIDNNEPKCILSPSRLRIPNSSYKILGHIPDISGHGNHGKINNSAYAKESGVNGYVENFNDWRISKPPMTVEKTDSQVHISYIGTSYKTLPMFEYTNPKVVYGYTLTVEITGIPSGCTGKFIHINTYTQEVTNGINTIKFQNDAGWFGFTFYREDGSIIGDCNITIKQIGEYKGAYCLDGVDDFVTIPTVTGGKQVLMKVNWQKEDGMIYNQNPGQDNFAIFANDYNGSNVVNAYASRNNGNTYIDGILNNNIRATRLKNVTHNITITNENVINNTIVPVIGANAAHNNFYAQMALYDFMLFDNISTDDKIKELNEYVGIEGNIFEFNPPMFTIDLPMAIKNIKVYQGGNEISPGYLYLNKDTEFEVYVSLNEGKYAVDTITVDGVEIAKDRVVGEYNIFKFTLNGSSEQKITIHSYEYIMYEDIPQPYPALLTFHDGNFNNYTYGDKVKLNSIIKVRAGFNLFPDLYTINSYYLNGEKLSFNALAAKDIVVTNDITLTAEKVYKLEGSAPKCIFSPSKLRIPNSSYKYLGYIPDISGNGNNGVFNNFAFSGMSGANGYLEDFTIMKDYGTSGIVRTESKIYLNESFNYKEGFWLGYTNSPSPAYKVKVSGIPETGMLTYTGGIWLNLVNGINELPARTNTAENHGFVVQSPGLDWSKLVIEQIGNYEGSICFDGIDDYIKIDTTGGMTMFMKANVISTADRILYDQRDKNSEGNMYKEFAILTSSSDSILAYAGRHTGTTYIDGILNTNITCGQLLNITHNITAVTKSNLVGTEQGVRIGASVFPASYCKAAVFDFMLFDAKCTDDVIKQLNDIIGIEGDYVQKPPYYWDAYGKSNLDGDRGTIPQLGTAEGYSFDSFDNTLDWYNTPNNDSVDVVSRNKYNITLKKLSGTNYWYFQNSTLKGMFSKEIPFKLKANKVISVIWDVHGLSISEGKDKSSRVQEIVLNPNEDISTKLKPLTKEELAERGISTNGVYYLLWFELSTLAVNEEVAIEMLPVEGGRNLWLNNYGFAYDKMSGYGGYSFSPFSNISDWQLSSVNDTMELLSTDGYSFTARRLEGQTWWKYRNKTTTGVGKNLSVKVRTNNSVRINWELKYRTAEMPDADSTVGLISTLLTPNVVTDIVLPVKTQEELDALGAISHFYLIYFPPTDVPVGEEYTVEMLPLYSNGLVLDGVDDYLENLDIPALSDFTVITKRTNLLEQYGDNVSYLVKGLAPAGSRDWALLMEYWYSNSCMNFIYDNSSGNAITPFDSIGFVTPTSYNGLPMTKGTSNDSTGLRIARRGNSYWNGVFYKLMLYPRTANMLTINMIKNMMAEDEIIDIHSKLFTDKFTGDFYNLDFNKDFLIGN